MHFGVHMDRHRADLCDPGHDITPSIGALFGLFLRFTGHLVPVDAYVAKEVGTVSKEIRDLNVQLPPTGGMQDSLSTPDKRSCADETTWSPPIFHLARPLPPRADCAHPPNRQRGNFGTTAWRRARAAPRA